ncbi:MAG: apolipoprotein N-acyltransferase [Salinispira sp.]
MNFVSGDIMVFLLAALHIAAGMFFLFTSRKQINGNTYAVTNAAHMAENIRKRWKRKISKKIRRRTRKTSREAEQFSDDAQGQPFFTYELLFAFSLIVFLFFYIFALAANMDYVQRFIASSGNLNLAIDTRTERIEVLLQYGLYLLVFPAALSLLTVADKGRNRRACGRILRHMGLVVGSALMHAFSFPSVLSANGFGALAWISLVPLFFVLRKSSFKRFLFYGLLWMFLSLLIRNYWLGTFSLVSLQVLIILMAVYGLLFFLILWFFEWGLRRFELKYPDKPALHIVFFVLVYGAVWTIFDWVKTQGFAAYPWTLMAHSQWRNLAFIQIGSITGMWGMSHLLYLVNGIVSAFFCFPSPFRRVWKIPAVFIFGITALIHIMGLIFLLNNPREAEQQAVIELKPDDGIITHYPRSAARNAMPNAAPSAAVPENTVRVALVQQNSDPHKHDYEQTLDNLIALSDGIISTVPDVDLVAWSETAFVPNIARWGAEGQDPNHRLVGVVQRMLDYQKNMNNWLLTGNDDYRIHINEEGREERRSYNAAILFSPEGERTETYHKIKLVPFTEYFPYREILPGVYNLLKEFDVHFWEPGIERVVFEHPDFTFSTPICFEDSFPDEVRRFVLAGAEVILNMSNDYWSLTEVAAKQHFAAALFRSVENRRYVLRSTASGMTAVVDPMGRVIVELPAYVPAAVAADIPVNRNAGTTLYTRFGDYYIVFLALSLSLFTGVCILKIALPASFKKNNS